MAIGTVGNGFDQAGIAAQRLNTGIAGDVPHAQRLVFSGTDQHMLSWYRSQGPDPILMPIQYPWSVGGHSIPTVPQTDGKIVAAAGQEYPCSSTGKCQGANPVGMTTECRETCAS